MKYYEVEFKITAPADAMQDARDLIAALAGDEGFEAFEETDCGTRGYVQTGAFDGGAIDRLVEDFPMDGVKIAYTIKDAEYRDWNEQWEENGFEPITIGSRCCIHDGRHLPQSHFDITIEINARLAFGTGTHETTRMMVACLLDARLDGKAMLDCGCGTGILAITALKLGAARAWVTTSTNGALTTHATTQRPTTLAGGLLPCRATPMCLTRLTESLTWWLPT